MANMFRDIREMSKEICRAPSETDDSLPVFISRVVAPGSRFIGGNSALNERIAKDFFKNHKSDLSIHVRETLQAKREFSKSKLVPGEYEMKIECLHGRFEFVYEMFDGNNELFEKRRTTYHFQKKPSKTKNRKSIKPSKDRFVITIRNEHSPAMVKVTIKEKKGYLSMKSSRFSFLFQVISVRHQLVKPGMWQVAKDVKLGEGGYASVYLGMNNLTGNLMAVKVCNLSSSQNMDALLRKMKLQQLEEEIETLKILNHENIVRYLGMEKVSDQEIYIFMDFISGGSIDWLLTQFTFNETLIQQHTKQVLNGLNYLHDREILHRDIKCSNILYDEAGKIYLTDFGSSIKKYTMDLSKSSSNSEELLSPSSSTETTENRKRKSSIGGKGIHGTPQFMAPEIWKHREYSTKSDVWAVGCTIYQMLTGKDPWESEMAAFSSNPIGFINYMSRKVDEKEYHINIIKKNNNNKEKEKEEEENKENKEEPIVVKICDIDELEVTEDLKDFIRSCFRLDPTRRPSVKQLLRHPWFDQVLPSAPSSFATNLSNEESLYNIMNKGKHNEAQEEEEEQQQQAIIGGSSSLSSNENDHLLRPKEEEEEEDIPTTPNFDFEDKYQSPDFGLEENVYSSPIKKNESGHDEDDLEENVFSRERLLETTTTTTIKKVENKRMSEEVEVEEEEEERMMLTPRMRIDKTIGYVEWKAITERGVKERILMMKTGRGGEEEVEGEGEEDEEEMQKI